MRKIFGLAIMLLMITSNCFAMTFSQPTIIGSIEIEPSGVMIFRGSSHSEGNVMNIIRNEKVYRVSGSGMARYGNNTTGLYVFYQNMKFNFGGNNKNFPVNVMSYTEINQIKNDGDGLLYLLKNDGNAAFARNYVLLGRLSNGDWARYFDSIEIEKQYLQPTKDIYITNVYCKDDTIIIDIENGRIHSKIGEFRFKWDDSAQWFGVEHVVY